jgi:hypothetical protein
MTPFTWIHIAGGTLGLVSGAAALSLRKGSRPHALAGTLFFGSMLVLGGTGAAIAAVKPERITAAIGILTCYLVATSWAAARRRDGRAGRFEALALAVALACAAALLAFGVQALPTGRLDSLPPQPAFAFAGLAALAAALDLNFILRGGVSGRQRIARHLWRMCAALLIAAFSFFLGQQKVMPLAWQGSPLLFVPPLAVLAAMLFWIVRVRFARAFRRPAASYGAPARLAEEAR